MTLVFFTSSKYQQSCIRNTANKKISNFSCRKKPPGIFSTIVPENIPKTFPENFSRPRPANKKSGKTPRLTADKPPPKPPPKTRKIPTPHPQSGPAKAPDSRFYPNGAPYVPGLGSADPLFSTKLLEVFV